MPLCKCCSGRGSSLTAAVALLLTACAGLLLAYPARDAVAGLIRAGVRGYSVLDSTSAGGWPGWLDSRDPSAGQVTSRYYVFNITNVEAVLKGAKPDVQQVSARGGAQSHACLRASAQQGQRAGAALPCRATLGARFVPPPASPLIDWPAGVQLRQHQAQLLVGVRQRGNSVPRVPAVPPGVRARAGEGGRARLQFAERCRILCRAQQPPTPPASLPRAATTPRARCKTRP